MEVSCCFQMMMLVMMLILKSVNLHTNALKQTDSNAYTASAPDRFG